MADLRSIAAERNRLAGELAQVDEDLRAAVRLAVSTGTPISRVAKEAGITRPTVYAWIRSDPESLMRVRLAELDRRYESLVDAIAAREKPPAEAMRLEAAYRNGQAGKRRRKGLGPLPTPTAAVRDFAEAKLLRLLEHDGGEDPVLSRIRDEIEEAWNLRQALADRDETRSGF